MANPDYATKNRAGRRSRLRALIYTRVSDDRRKGQSPREQEAEAREECERRDWEVAEVVTDAVGASRYSKGTRAGWEAVKRRLAVGDIDVLVTWESSRAQRGLDGYTDLRRLCVEYDVMWSYQGKIYDLNDGDDRYKTGQDALNDERSSEETSRRVLRTTRAQARLGRPHGRRLYGYRREYDGGQLVRAVPDIIVDDAGREVGGEALVIRRIFRDYIGGIGARTIATALTAEGVPTPNRNAKWASSTVRSLLRNPSYVGERWRRGEKVGDADWEPVIDRELFDLVQTRCAAQAAGPVRQASVAWLLTGTGRCGVCGGRLGGLKRSNGQRAYQCRERFCVARHRDKVDAYVVAELLERLTNPDVLEQLSGSSPDPAVESARATSAKLQAQLADAVAVFNRGDLSATTLGHIEADLLPKIAEADRAVRRALVPLLVVLPDEPDQAWWDSLDRNLQREIVRAWIVSVVIEPTVHKKKFDPSKIRIEFRG